MGIISGFSNVKELYQKIAECFDIPVSEVCFNSSNNNYHLIFYVFYLKRTLLCVNT